MHPELLSKLRKGTRLTLLRLQVLAITYLGGKNGGGFYPNGVNGNIKTSTASS